MVRLRAHLTVVEEGPIPYTVAVLEGMLQVSRDPAERAAFAKAMEILGRGCVEDYRNVPFNIGIINTKEGAMIALVAFIGSKISWMDAQTRLAGKDTYERMVRNALATLARKIKYEGRWEALAQGLVRRASAYWNW